jgi:hypothetical protein
LIASTRSTQAFFLFGKAIILELENQKKSQTTI